MKGDVLDLAIVGAGPAGLALAIAMKQKGLSIKVFEAAPEIKERGAAVFLQVMHSLLPFARGAWKYGTPRSDGFHKAD